MTTHTLAMGEGEHLQRRRERQVLAVKGGLFATGMIGGGWIGYNIAANGFSLSGNWPPSVALALAVIYVAAIAIGSVLLHKHIDEVERMATYKAITVAGTAYMIGYPVWFLLWKANVAPEPVHWMLFVGFWALLIGSAFRYRSR